MIRLRSFQRLLRRRLDPVDEIEAAGTVEQRDVGLRPGQRQLLRHPPVDRVPVPVLRPSQGAEVVVDDEPEHLGGLAGGNPEGLAAPATLHGAEILATAARSSRLKGRLPVEGYRSLFRNAGVCHLNIRRTLRVQP